ncbi:transposase [Microtetraspora malaysiensis]|uniref:transposase n=1 Tax=Microtetraspora malaysiensis TaxID=161358 RepID=UPI003D8D832C
MLTIASVREVTEHIGASSRSHLRSLIDFRAGLHRLLWRRADALFELTDAMLCAQGPVRSPVELSMEPEFRRGHGSVYAALDQGRIDTGGLRRLLLGVSAAARPGEPLMFALDVTPDARPDAEYADERVMVQVRGKGGDKFLPGWPYSLLVGVQWGDSSWVDPIEARRLRPGEEHTDVTIEQITGLLADLEATGRLTAGDPPPLIMLDAGNYATDITHALAGRHVQILVRLRATRVFYADPEPRRPGEMGAGKRHGREFSCSDAAKRHAPDIDLTAGSVRYGTVTVRAWKGLHQKLTRTGRWAGHSADERLPIVRGTVLQIVVDRLPDGRRPTKDLWLWHAGPVEVDPDLVDLLWKAYLRRFDQEHFHRFAKVYLGMARAHLASAQATDRWMHLIMAAYAQLRLASPHVDDLRRPWHPRPERGKPLSPYRVRLGFRRLRAKLGTPTDSPKLTRPGPGRPKGSRNRPKDKRPPYRKTVTTDNEHRE